MDGWLQTKRRGVDDVQIEQDRSKALQKRKERRGLSKKPAARQPKAKPKKRRQQSDDESSLESLADFVVDDDEDDCAYSENDKEDTEQELSELEEEESSSDDEVLDSKPAARKRKPPQLQDDDDDTSDDDQEAGSTFFQPYKKRTSRPPPKAKAVATLKRPKKARKLQNKAAKAVVDLLSDDDDDDDDDGQFDTVPAAAAKKRVIPKKRALHVAGYSSDEQDEIPTSSMLLSEKPKPLPPVTGKTSHHFAPKAAAKKQSPVAKRGATDDDDDNETPLAARKRPVAGNKRRAIVDSDDDSDDDCAVVVATKTPQPSTSSQDDFASDDDETMAVTLALSKSLHETKQVSASAQEQEEKELIDVDLQDSSEDEGDEQDAYCVDEDAKEAGSILEIANELSAHVLQTMIKWSAARKSSSGDNDGGDTNNNSTVPMGMIVDGALALSGMGGDSNSSTSASTAHDWISPDLMREVCPKVTLANYQLIGVNWMALLHGMKCDVKGRKTKHNVNGILADEMGLGKTVQTIAFLSWLKHTNQKGGSKAGGSSNDKAIALNDDDEDSEDASVDNENDTGGGPHLVIAPSSVLANWKREFDNFAPHLNVVKYHGTQSERLELQEQLRLHLPGREANRRRLGLEPLDVILAPVTYFQKEKSDDRTFLKRFGYDYLVVDEAHMVCKNAKGTRYKSLNKFVTSHRLLLTGTPVQNNPKELMALLCFLMPLFSSKSSSAHDEGDHNDGGESMLQHFVSLEGGRQDASATAYKKLKQLFAPFVLRRSKADVLSQILPPKDRRVEFVELEKTGRSTYDSVISNHLKAKKKGNALSREHLFTQLRKAAHHPLLLRTRYTSTAEKEHLTHWFYRYGAFRGEGCTKAKVAEELERYTDFRIHLTTLDLIEENELRRPELERYVLDQSDLFSSAKFVKLRQLLPGLVADGHRILIFSVWTTCLDLLSCLLEQMNLGYLRMDGSTTVSDRQGLIDKFNNDASIPVFLLSTKACGMGINLTAADTCIVHDLDFNPFNDLQAEDRCHRIGQKKPVTVIKLVSKDTVDEDIYEMQQRKAKMNAAIMESGPSESGWTKEAPKNKDVVLQTAVERFLKSPKAKHPPSIPDENQDENSADVRVDV